MFPMNGNPRISKGPGGTAARHIQTRRSGALLGALVAALTGLCPLALVLATADCGGRAAATSCEYAARDYPLGASFTAVDGCNRCTCSADGVACTEIACAPGQPDGGGCTYNG